MYDSSACQDVAEPRNTSRNPEKNSQIKALENQIGKILSRYNQSKCPSLKITFKMDTFWQVLIKKRESTDRESNTKNEKNKKTDNQWGDLNGEKTT